MLYGKRSEHCLATDLQSNCKVKGQNPAQESLDHVAPSLCFSFCLSSIFSVWSALCSQRIGYFSAVSHYCARISPRPQPSGAIHSLPTEFHYPHKGGVRSTDTLQPSGICSLPGMYENYKSVFLHNRALCCSHGCISLMHKHLL